MSEESPSVWWKPWRWPWGVWACALVLLFMLVPFGIRALYLSVVPEMDEPFDVKAFVGDDIPPSENAFTFYRQASDLHQRLVAGLQQNSSTEPITYEAVYEQGWTAIDEPLKKWLDDHRQALVLWRRGTEMDRALNLSPADMTFATVIDVVQDQRAFSRLARLELARCLDEGNIEDAWNWGRAMFRNGGHTSQRGCMLQGLVAVALHAMAAQGMARWAEHPAVTAEQLREALAAIRADHALYEPASNIYKSEYLVCRNSLSSRMWMGMIGGGAVTPNDALQAQASQMFYRVVGESELTARLFRQILANQIREIDKPVSTRAKMTGSSISLLFTPDPTTPLAPRQLDPAGIDRGLKMSFLARHFIPATKHVDDGLLRRRALQVALEALVAAQAYRRDKGEFPESLSQLVPHYLEGVPLDPCDPSGGTLLYRRDSATEAVVWSVGNDGMDSGGDVVSTNGRPTDTGFVLKVAQPK
jgi:hypothetical protein